MQLNCREKAQNAHNMRSKGKFHEPLLMSRVNHPFQSRVRLTLFFCAFCAFSRQSNSGVYPRPVISMFEFGSNWGEVPVEWKPMKTILLLALTLFLGAPRAFALAGQLDQPGVALPADYPKIAQEQVAAALKWPDCRFLKGHFINWHTSLLYAGDTKALNLLLDALAKCPGVTLHVSFVADPIPGEPCDWVVAHDALANSFHVLVNLKSERITLPELYLPEVKGPAVKLVTALTKGELVGEWSGPCTEFRLAADGTGAWLVKDPSGPLPKPEPFKWKLNGAILLLREPTGERKLDVARTDGNSLELKFPNGSTVGVWRREPRPGAPVSKAIR